MTSLECARAAFAALCENSPANHCRVLESSVLDAGKEVPGGWSSARTLTEGLYGGKAIVNVSQQRLGEEQVPTVEILCDDPVLAAGSFAIRDGLVGLREADVLWGWSCCPVVFPSLDGEAVRAAHRAAIAAHGVCSIWVRRARADLEVLARNWDAFRLRLHCLEDGKTYGARG